MTLHDVPVRMLGVKLDLTPDQAKPVRDRDPFFMHSTHSTENMFVFLSSKFHRSIISDETHQL